MFVGFLSIKLPLLTSPFLCFLFPSSNPKLESIPALASDLQIIIQWAGRLENGEPSHVPSEETPEANKDDQSKRPVFMFDLNCPPCAVATPEICDNQENDTEPPGLFPRLLPIFHLSDCKSSPK